ncbi:hypothetical protein GALMADRAFT_131516 [Galerina marginata CBS 339.88]|uniref:Uncharacterized protein n=1 Tax=Galerina marginata (strain CBS 339.88) TaxID=685588 RepID=A0A067TQX0_GALM3|nr:hypothetical protein GALMADRAFT_131516 [Galerina marginata CBS 339.88]
MSQDRVYLIVLYLSIFLYNQSSPPTPSKYFLACLQYRFTQILPLILFLHRPLSLSIPGILFQPTSFPYISWHHEHLKIIRFLQHMLSNHPHAHTQNSDQQVLFPNVFTLQQDLNVLPGFQEIQPSLTRSQLYSPSTSSLIIPTDTLDIKRIDFAWQYLGAIWIITFNLLIVKNALSPGSRVLFGNPPANDVCYRLTCICYVYDYVLHVEAVAYDNRGCSSPKTSKDWPPIVIRLPRHKVIGFDAEITRAEADQGRMCADTSLQPRWKFWFQPFFNKPIPVDPRDYYTPNPRRF